MRLISRGRWQGRRSCGRCKCEMRIFILYIRADPTDVPVFQKNVAKIKNWQLLILKSQSRREIFFFFADFFLNSFFF